MPAPTLDAYQQIFALSMLSNKMSAHNGPQTALQQMLMYALSPYLSKVPQGQVPAANWVYPTPMPNATAVMGNWSLVWGPAVWESTASGDQSNIADNAMFVAYCDNLVFPGSPNTAGGPVYVVATAATNPAASYDWLVEDFTVSTVVDFEKFNPTNVQTAVPIPGKKYISKGTAIGVSNLLTNLASPSGAVAQHSSLQQFLTTIDASDQATIVFTGHSLAGALSPALAFYLQQQGELKQFAQVLVYPTAGATPGNDAFATAFNAAFPALPPNWTAPEGQEQYQYWNTDLWNTLDVVPHAWLAAALAEVPTLYGSPALPDIQALINTAQVNAAASLVIYTRIQNNELMGSQPLPAAPLDGVYTSISVPPTTNKDFLIQLGLQHVNMYMGIPPFTGPGDPTVQVEGLILTQPLPKPTDPNYQLLFGVTAVSDATMLNNALAWIGSRGKQHT